MPQKKLVVIILAFAALMAGASCGSTATPVKVNAKRVTVTRPTLPIPSNTIPGVQAKITLSTDCVFSVNVGNQSSQDVIITILTDSSETSEIAAAAGTQTILSPRFMAKPNTIELITPQGGVIQFFEPDYGQCRQAFVPLDPNAANVGDTQVIERLEDNPPPTAPV